MFKRILRDTVTVSVLIVIVTRGLIPRSGIQIKEPNVTSQLTRKD